MYLDSPGEWTLGFFVFNFHCIGVLLRKGKKEGMSLFCPLKTNFESSSSLRKPQLTYSLGLVTSPEPGWVTASYLSYWFPRLSSPLSGTPSFLLFGPHPLKLLAVLCFQLTDSPLSVHLGCHTASQTKHRQKKILDFCSSLNPSPPSLPFLSRHHDQKKAPIET